MLWLSYDNDDMEDCGWLPRGLDALGQGLSLAGGGLILAAMLSGGAAIGGLLYGAALGTAGMFTRAAAFAIGAWEIEHRGIVVTEERPVREALQSLAAGIEVVKLPEERDPAQAEARFVSMLVEQEHRRLNGKGF